MTADTFSFDAMCLAQVSPNECVVFSFIGIVGHPHIDCELGCELG